MKKALTILFTVLLLVLSVSCFTVSTYSEITEEEAAYSMNLAMTTALKNSISRMAISTDKMNTLPPQYAVLSEYRTKVPGLDALLSQWDESVKSGLKASYVLFVSELEMPIANLVFTDPLNYISSSDTSGSEYFVSLYADKVYDISSEICKNIDYSTLSDAVKQYNTYLKATDFLYKTETPRLEEQDVSKYFTDIVAENFLTALYSSEELYRTTPDPYKDRTAAVVFSVE